LNESTFDSNDENHLRVYGNFGPLNYDGTKFYVNSLYFSFLTDELFNLNIVGVSTYAKFIVKLKFKLNDKLHDNNFLENLLFVPKSAPKEFQLNRTLLEGMLGFKDLFNARTRVNDNNYSSEHCSEIIVMESKDPFQITVTQVDIIYYLVQNITHSNNTLQNIQFWEYLFLENQKWNLAVEKERTAQVLPSKRKPDWVKKLVSETVAVGEPIKESVIYELSKTE
jgi:hypothetical protein